MGKHGVVYGKGVNDMSRGWYSESEYNKRVYHVWQNMLKRCYSEKWHAIHQTYKDCYCCERWLKLSNFVEDIVKIPNYEYWLSGFSEKRNPYQLDKDIKSGGANKCYCLEQCIFVNYADNTRQAMLTRNYDNIRGELVAQIEPSTDKIINLRYNREYIESGFNQGNISSCCRGSRYKTSQGYIWKYISDCTPEQINKYIIRTKQIKIE